MTKKHVSLLVVFVLLFTTLFSSFVFAADDKWELADDITINVKAHVQTFGDQSYTGKGEIAFGTEGKAKRLENFNVTLEGAPADMELVGMAHVQSFGDMPATGFKAGEVGTKGLAKRIEGVAFKLVKKGTDTLYPGYRISYAAHMQSFGWGISKDVNSVVAKNFDGAEDFASNGQFAGTKGLSKRIESVSLIIEREEADLAVKEVSASNLKEIDVRFNKAVDKVTAETLQAYSVVKNNVAKTISSATLVENGTVVRLFLADGSELTNQDKYKISFTGVKSADLKETVEVKDYEFKALDTTLPVVEKVESLGKKTIKVTFSEPVKFVAGATVAQTFKLNGASLFANNDIDGRTIILSLFQELAEGEHTLTINNKIQDYALYNLVITDEDFVVVKDDVKPAVAEVKDVTYEGFTVVFTEDVDDATVDKANFKYTEGSRTIKATSLERIDARTYRVKIALPGYKVSVGITGVKDYSGNVIDSATKVELVATLDQTRPEVLGFRYNETAGRFEVTFSKEVNKDTFKSSNVVVKDSNAKVVSNSYTATLNSAKIMYIAPSLAIGAGKYTFELAGIKDTTKLENAMEPYTAEFSIKDTTAPVAGSSITEGVGNQFIITFDKAMETSGQYSILNPANYYVQYTTTDGTTIVGTLPDGTSLTPLNDSKGVIMVFDSSIQSVASITIQGVKGVNGNFLSGYAKTYTISGTATALQVVRAVAEGTKTVKVKLGAEIGAVNRSLISVNGTVVKSAEITSDKTVVELTLNTAIPTVLTSEKLTWTAGAFTSLLGKEIAANGTGVAISDNIAPEVVTNSDGDIEYVEAASNTGEGFVAVQTARTIFVNLTESVKVKGASSKDVADALLAANLKVTKANGGELTYPSDYSFGAQDFQAGDDEIEIILASNLGYVGPVFVQFTNSGNVIQVANGNKLSDGAALEVKLGNFTNADLDAETIIFDTKAPTATLDAVNSTATALKLTLSETATIATTGTPTWTDAAAGVNQITSATPAVSGNVVKFTVTDGSGNSKAYTATYTTSWSVVAD